MNTQHLDSRPWRTALGFAMSLGLIALSFWLSSMP
jgi:heme/copper-type cytochrome/quinol oxidase subunit 4